MRNVRAIFMAGKAVCLYLAGRISEPELRTRVSDAREIVGRERVDQR